MSGVEREQAFVATYHFDVPCEDVVTGEGESTFWLVDGESEFYLTTARGNLKGNLRLVEWVRAHGGTIREEKGASKRTKIVPPWWREGIGQVTEAGQARATDGHFHLSEAWASIETPTRLGSQEHVERRAILERFLREHDIKYTVECSTKHSDRVCRPLNLAAAEAAPVA